MKNRKILMFVVAVSLFSGLLAIFFGLSGPTPALAAGGATNLPADEPAADSQILSPQVRPESGSGLALPSGQSMGQPLLLSTPALTVTKVSAYLGGGSLQPGERISYTIAISNGGSTAATGVVVSDTFPANTDFVTDTIVISPPAAGGTPGTLSTQPVIASGLTVTAGSWVTVTYAVTASATAPDETEIVNTASVTSSQVATPTMATVVDTVDVLPDFVVLKNASPTSVPESGATVTFAVEIINFNDSESLTIDLLTDNVHGNLSVPCSIPKIIAADDNYACNFMATVSGDVGVPEIDTVTARGVDDDGNTLTKFANATVTFIDVPSSITVTKTANPISIPEPGGIVAFTVQVDNTSPGDSVTVNSLSDDKHGNLNGQGDCSVPQTISRSSSYPCTYPATVTGNAGESETSTVTVNATDDDAVPLVAANSATVTFSDVLPTIDVTKSANPSTIAEPGGSVNFTVRVENTSPAEPLTLTALNDDTHGDLNGQGSCSVTQIIPVGGTYQCSYSATVNGVEGQIKTSEVTADVSDDDGNDTSASDDTMVTIGPTLPIYLPLIYFPGLTVLDVKNDTSASIRVAVDGTSIVNCLVPSGNQTECGTFPAGSYIFRVIDSVCGPGTKVIPYSPGPALTTVSCP